MISLTMWRMSLTFNGNRKVAPRVRVTLRLILKVLVVSCVYPALVWIWWLVPRTVVLIVRLLII